MNIVLIDDDIGVLDLMVVLLRRLGHQVYGYSDPRHALSKLTWETDLVISDISMPGLDGFDVAERVQTMLGNQFPKTLLISGSDHQVRLERYSPSVVMGILAKPFKVNTLPALVSLLEKTRLQCPGTQGVHCSRTMHMKGKQCGGSGERSLCLTADYAKCPSYDSECGKSLRLLIQRGSGG